MAVGKVWHDGNTKAADVSRNARLYCLVWGFLTPYPAHRLLPIASRAKKLVRMGTPLIVR